MTDDQELAIGAITSFVSVVAGVGIALAMACGNAPQPRPDARPDAVPDSFMGCVRRPGTCGAEWVPWYCTPGYEPSCYPEGRVCRSDPDGFEATLALRPGWEWEVSCSDGLGTERYP